MAVTAAGWALTNGVTVALLAADLLLPRYARTRSATGRPRARPARPPSRLPAT